MVVSDNFLHLISQGYPKPRLFSVVCWLLHKLNGYQCKAPNDNIWAKADSSHVCRHGEVQEKPKAGQGETMAGQQAGGSRPDIDHDIVVHDRDGSPHVA